MDAIDSLGVFWLPGHGDDKLSGRLQFEPVGGGIRLSLVGAFEHAVDNHGDPSQRVFGWIGNEPVTLDRCFTKGTNHRSPGVIESSYHANRMFIGHHLESENQEYQSAEVTFSHTGAWLRQSGINVETNYFGESANSGAIYTATYTPIPQTEQPFSRGLIKLGYAWRPAGDPIDGVEMKQWPVFTLVYEKPRGLKDINTDVRNIQNLITLCIDTPVDNDRFALKHPDIRVRMLDGSESEFPQPIVLVASPIPYTPPDQRKPRAAYQMLLTFDELGGLPAIARWLDLAPTFQRALASLMSVRYADSVFVENRFLNTTYGAEAYHRLTQNSPQMEQEEFDRVLAACLGVTPEAHREWLLGKIGYGNDPSLVKRLSRLAGRAAAANGLTGRKKDRWASTLSQVRNALTHLNTHSPEFHGSDLLFLTESVYAVVRTCMLLDCGVPSDLLAKKADSGPLAWYRRRLDDAMDRVREDLKQAHGSM